MSRLENQNKFSSQDNEKLEDDVMVTIKLACDKVFHIVEKRYLRWFIRIMMLLDIIFKLI